MSANIFLVVSAAFLHMSNTCEPAAPEASENAALFQTFCKLWRLTETQVPATAVDTTGGQTYQDIQNYNMSVSSTDWQQLFDTEGADGEWAKMAITLKANENKLEWEQYWPIWKRARKETKRPTDPWPKAHPHNPAGKPDRSSVRHIQRLAAAAKSKVRKLAAQAAETAADKIQAIESALQKAKCGTAEHASDPKKKQCKELTAAAAKTAQCATGQNGKSLANDIICVCATTGIDVCGITAGTEIINGANIQTSAIAKIASSCPQITDDEDLAQAIDTALATLEAHIGKRKYGASVHLLGTSHTTECTDSDSAECIAYTSYFASNSKGLAAVPWVEHLLTAAKLYRQYSQADTASKDLAQQLTELGEDIAREYTRQPEILIESGNHPAAGQKEENKQQQNKCILRNKTAGECPATDCDYDSEKRACKPKPVTETTTEGKKFSPKKNQEDCKSPDCK
ncbi:variant surface glycoprotein (VSG), putative [Trypanosoma equiperdum]|uniref:Variant surface glycoprotein (VSG), putative n=1 Tax=Trypanosoma equiperdum TaxID=5694 RepID=A0A1G4IKN0_TRYEQ|nr:variant surface glycoprotein (VSG), putative [Trypanosoma equiperdum]